MKFFANHMNGNFLLSILPGEDIEIDWVQAAIAYGDDSSTLIENCIQNERKLEIWMRYDHKVPVSPKLLRYLLKSFNRNIFCYLIPDVLHSKVIWWKNYGIYIGSANLTDRAWRTNIEFGVFISEEDLEEDDQLNDLELFFDSLMNCNKSFPLTEEIIKEQEDLYSLRSGELRKLDNRSAMHRLIKQWEGPADVPEPKKLFDKKKEKFLEEWNESLTVLRNLAVQAPNYKPTWINSDVPAAWQADQFLHAYYYNKVTDGHKHPYEEFHNKHKADPALAVNKALVWWSKLPTPPSGEDLNCHVRAPIIRHLLTVEGVLNLTLDDFTRICKANHSTMDHVRRSMSSRLGLDGNDYSVDQKVSAFAKILWSKTNLKGESISDLLAFIIDGGPSGNISSRLYDAANSKDRKFAHFGINQIAEIIGWARPEISPPRNGRTSKALRALGYNVGIY